MEYTSNQRAAIFLVARWTKKLKNNMPIGMYLRELPEVKQAVREYNRKNPWDYTYTWYDPGFAVETRNDYSKAMDGLNYRIDVLEDYAGYSIYDLE